MTMLGVKADRNENSSAVLRLVPLPQQSEHNASYRTYTPTELG